MAVASTTFPVSTVNMLQNTARSWYDAGYVNLRRRYSNGLSLLANYTYAKNLSNAPDFRSPMFESAIPQNNNDLDAEKGLGLRRPAPFRGQRRIRHSFAGGAQVDPCAHAQLAALDALSGAERVPVHDLGVRGHGKCRDGSGRESDPRELHRSAGVRIRNPNHESWFNPAAFATPAAYTFGNVGRNTVYGPGMQTHGHGTGPVLRDHREGCTWRCGPRPITL